MNRLSIKDLFNGYKNVSFPYELDVNNKTEAMPFRTDAPCGSLLFITEKVGGTPEKVYVSTAENAPIAIVASESQEIEASSPIIRVENARVALAYALANQNGLDCSKI